MSDAQSEAKENVTLVRSCPGSNRGCRKTFDGKSKSGVITTTLHNLKLLLVLFQNEKFMFSMFLFSKQPQGILLLMRRWQGCLDESLSCGAVASECQAVIRWGNRRRFSLRPGTNIIRPSSGPVSSDSGLYRWLICTTSGYNPLSHPIDITSRLGTCKFLGSRSLLAFLAVQVFRRSGSSFARLPLRLLKRCPLIPLERF